MTPPRMLKLGLALGATALLGACGSLGSLTNAVPDTGSSLGPAAAPKRAPAEVRGPEHRTTTHSTRRRTPAAAKPAPAARAKTSPTAEEKKLAVVWRILRLYHSEKLDLLRDAAAGKFEADLDRAALELAALQELGPVTKACEDRFAGVRLTTWHEANQPATQCAWVARAGELGKKYAKGSVDAAVQDLATLFREALARIRAGEAVRASSLNNIGGLAFSTTQGWMHRDATKVYAAVGLALPNDAFGALQFAPKELAAAAKSGAVRISGARNSSDSTTRAIKAAHRDTSVHGKPLKVVEVRYASKGWSQVRGSSGVLSHRVRKAKILVKAHTESFCRLYDATVSQRFLLRKLEWARDVALSSNARGVRVARCR